MRAVEEWFALRGCGERVADLLAVPREEASSCRDVDVLASLRYGVEVLVAIVRRPHRQQHVEVAAHGDALSPPLPARVRVVPLTDRMKRAARRDPQTVEPLARGIHHLDARIVLLGVAVSNDAPAALQRVDV